MNLRKAAEQALEALIEYEKSYPAVADGLKPLRAALAEEVMQRLTDVQQELDCYGDGNVYRGQRSSDSKTPTLTINGMPAVEGPLSKAHRTCQESRQVEPVAWATVGFVTWGNRQIEKVDKLTREAQPEYGFVIPLYAAPPKRKPLTDAEIKRLYDSLPSKYTLAMFARAIERAHGIGGEE